MNLFLLQAVQQNADYVSSQNNNTLLNSSELEAIAAITVSVICLIVCNLINKKKAREHGEGKQKYKNTAFVLWLFYGLLGAHKYYLGRKRMGIAYTCTFGFVGIGWLFDIFSLFIQVDVSNGLRPKEDASLLAVIGRMGEFVLSLFVGIGGILLRIGRFVVGILTGIGKLLLFIFVAGAARASSRDNSTTTRTTGAKATKAGVPKTNYYCKHCGRRYSDVWSLTHNSCGKSPTGNHELYEGGEKSQYTCKYCGRKYSDLWSLTHNSCGKSPTGNHSPAL